jgi:hypothetical protein
MQLISGTRCWLTDDGPEYHSSCADVRKNECDIRNRDMMAIARKLVGARRFSDLHSLVGSGLAELYAWSGGRFRGRPQSKSPNFEWFGIVGIPAIQFRGRDCVNIPPSSPKASP